MVVGFEGLIVVHSDVKITQSQNLRQRKNKKSAEASGFVQQHQNIAPLSEYAPKPKWV
jgi:hypothetical protein